MKLTILLLALTGCASTLTGTKLTHCIHSPELGIPLECKEIPYQRSCIARVGRDGRIETLCDLDPVELRRAVDRDANSL